MACDVIIEAIATQLKDLYPEAKVYLSAVNQGAMAPCFFIFCPLANVERRLYGARQVERMYQVMYLSDSDSPSPAEDCQEVLLTLLRHLEEIETSDGPYRAFHLQGTADDGEARIELTIRHRERDTPDTGPTIHQDTTTGGVK